MQQDSFNEFISGKFIVFSAILTVLVWGVFTYLLTPFVPTETLPWMYILSGFTSIPIAGVFFFSSYMFQLVLQEQIKARRSA
jgi:hypothetical protein